MNELNDANILKPGESQRFHKQERNAFLRLYEIFGIYFVAVILLFVGVFVNVNFFTADNFLNVLRNIALLGIASCGMAFVVYIGKWCDLSLPSYMALSGTVAIACLPLGFVPALICGVLAGMAIGAMNGLVVGWLNANPILWTLAVVYFMEGFMRFTWSNNQIYPDQVLESRGLDTTAADHFLAIFQTDVFSIPLIVVVMILMFVLCHFVLTRTKFGLFAKYVGSSLETAKSSGVNVKLIVLYSFLATAFCGSIAGIFITSLNKLGVFYLGQGYDFKSVTAVVIGGMMQSGGRGSMIGVFGGVLVIGLLSNIMNFIGINTFQQDIITGSIFILVVGFHQYQLRSQGKDYA